MCRKYGETHEVSRLASATDDPVTRHLRRPSLGRRTPADAKAICGSVGRTGIQEAVALGLDGETRAHQVAGGAQVVGPGASHVAAQIAADGVLVADVVVLIFDAEDDVDQRALVHHVVEASADIPAPLIARLAVAGRQAAQSSDVGAGCPFSEAEAPPPVTNHIQRSQA
jgi:hypothetical protein